MKVLFLTYSLSRNAGGLFFSVRSLARQLLDSGIKSYAVAPHDALTDCDAEKWAPVPVSTYPVLGPKSLGFSTGIEPLIGTPDIQHMHGIWMYQSHVNRRTARAANTPYVISPRGMLDAWALRNSGWKKKISGALYEQKHLRDAACLHALCESEAASMREFGLTNPICVIPNAVDLPEISPVDREESRRKTLLFLGRIHPKKGLVQLINAFARISPSVRKDWSVQIAGWDQNHQRELEQLAFDRGVGADIQFLGPKFNEEKKRLYEECDAFVLPSHSEGLPMSVLEAWSYGKPTVITTACNLPEGTRHNAAIECEPSIDGLETSLCNLFSLRRSEREQLGKNARQLVEQQFTWEIVAEKMSEVYRWLLGQAQRPETVHTIQLPLGEGAQRRTRSDDGSRRNAA